MAANILLSFGTILWQQKKIYQERKGLLTSRILS